MIKPILAAAALACCPAAEANATASPQHRELAPTTASDGPAAPSSGHAGGHIRGGPIPDAPNCLQHEPYTSRYTLRKYDTCQSIFRPLNFTSPAELERVNKPISRFTCAKARQGQLICYRPKD